MKTLIGPFTQVLTMNQLPIRGPIVDSQLEIVPHAGILVDKGVILDIAKWTHFQKEPSSVQIKEIPTPTVAMPGIVDSHTHLCYSGTRVEDYSKRIAGVSYLDIAKEGGGIHSTVEATRKASLQELVLGILSRAKKQLQKGITTCEVKSGYGLNVETELKMLEAINIAHTQTDLDVIPTCLAAHSVPRDFDGSSQEYLDCIASELLPQVKKNNWAHRVDIFIEKGAFNTNEGLDYLNKARSLGFTLTIHGDQFTPGGCQLAIETQAVSVDHLECCQEKDIIALAKSKTFATALPGASLGLGCDFMPARRLLNEGGRLVIASDWNPGSAPMGDLLTQAAVLSAFQKLSHAETLAALTFFSAQSLQLFDRGVLKKGKKADIIAFPTNDYRNILYYQGQLKPTWVWKNGKEIPIS